MVVAQNIFVFDHETVEECEISVLHSDLWGRRESRKMSSHRRQETTSGGSTYLDPLLYEAVVGAAVFKCRTNMQEKKLRTRCVYMARATALFAIALGCIVYTSR